MDSDMAHQLALSFQEKLIENLETELISDSVSSEYIKNFVNSFCEISPRAQSRHDIVVGSYSVKPLNVTLNLKDALNDWANFTLLTPAPSSGLEAVKIVLYIIYKICQLNTIELTDKERNFLLVLHRMNAYERRIEDSSIFPVVKLGMTKYGYPELSDEEIRIALNNLHKYRCVDQIDGCWYLKERILLI